MIAKIVRAILTDQPRVMTVSNVLQNYHGIDEVCLSVPTVVRKSGICDKLDVTFDEKEEEQFNFSAQKIKEAIEKTKNLLQ